MKTISSLSLAVIVGACTVSAADITGKITLKGTPPAEKPLPFDPACGALHPGSKPTTRFYVVDKSGGLADVVVTLDGLKGKSKGAEAPPAVIDQKGCEYVPYVLAAQTNQKIVVKNSDPMLHNIHPTPKPGTGNQEANKAQLPKGPELTFTFPDAEDFLRFKCDVHSWMFAYVTVVDHPYFSVSGADGTFKIANVPAGSYTLKIAHRKGGEQTQKIEVKDQSVTANFTVEAK